MTWWEVAEFHDACSSETIHETTFDHIELKRLFLFATVANDVPFVVYFVSLLLE